MILVRIICLTAFFCIACQQQTPTKEKSLIEIKTENENIRDAAIIRNPVGRNNSIDTINVAQMAFDAIRYHYGEVEEGTIVSHKFKFKNIGKVSLVITDCRSTCGCTVSECPKEPIPVGGDGAILVKFNTEKKENFQTKPIFITANTHPSETTLYLIGRVKQR